MVSLQIINKVLKTKDIDLIIKNDLVEEHFIGCESYYNFLMNHYRRYGNIPDPATFLDAFEDFELLDVTESDEYLIDKIQEEYLYSKLVPVLQDVAGKLQHNSIEAYEALRTAVMNVQPKTSTYGVDIIAQAHLRYESYVKKRDSDTPWMYPTGFPELDEHIGGLAKEEEFVVIVARTNQGKSWILEKIATHIWHLGANVGYISPEMSYDNVGYRFDTLYEHFSNFSLYKGKDVPDYEEYINELETKTKYKFLVSTPADFNRKITISKLRSYCLQNNIQLLCVDGIKYLADERYKRGDNVTTSLTNISEDLMGLSLELGIPIVVVVQSNRSGAGLENGAPDLESIRDSDGIAHNATKVLSIRQKDNKLNMVIKKNRNGPVDVTVVYDWNIDTGEFVFDPSSTDDSYREETDNGNYSSSARRSSSNSNDKLVENKQPLRRTISAPIPTNSTTMF